MSTRDPRLHGSKNPGVTNVLRTAGKRVAVLVLIADMFKGFFPLYFWGWFHFSYTSLCWIGLCAVVGHMYPIFFGFKGGKGIATTFGVLLALFPYLSCILALLWLAVILLTRIVSLASLCAALFLPFAAYWTDLGLQLPVFLISGLIIWKHRANIKRLRMGNEPRLSFSSKK